MAKRNVFGELMEGVTAMKKRREGKLTLRSYKIDPAPLPKVDSKLIRDTRKKLRCSRAVFARKLRINERTLEKWEQGRAKPNPQPVHQLRPRRLLFATICGENYRLMWINAPDVVQCTRLCAQLFTDLSGARCPSFPE